MQGSNNTPVALREIADELLVDFLDYLLQRTQGFRHLYQLLNLGGSMWKYISHVSSQKGISAEAAHGSLQLRKRLD